MKKTLFIALIAAALTAACSDKGDLNKNRGPVLEAFDAQNQLILPPDFYLRAPDPENPVVVETPDTAQTVSEPAAPLPSAPAAAVMEQTKKGSL